MNDRVVEFWCRIPVELQTVFDRFCSAFPVGEYIHDAENVWEWFDGRTADDSLGFNITRPWDADTIPDEPVRMSIAIRDPSLTADQIGNGLASALDTDVHTGTVNYLHGDKFDFKVERTFRRRTAHGRSAESPSA